MPQKQEIVRTSNEFVNKLVTPDKVNKGRADPQLLFDYRCYLPGVPQCWVCVVGV